MNPIRYPWRQQGEAFQETLCWEAAETTDPARLEALAKEDATRARLSSISIEVARNPNTPATVLEELSRAKELLVQCALLQNPSLSAELLIGLITRASRCVLRGIAASVRDETILRAFDKKLEGSSSTRTHKTLAQNINTPTPVLKQVNRRWVFFIVRARKDLLTGAQDPGALAPYRERINDTQDAWFQGALVGAASDPKTSSTLLSFFASLGQPRLSFYLARNPNTPPSLLEGFAQNTSMSSQVAANPSTPVSMLETLSKQTSLRPYIAANSNAPVTLLARLAKTADAAVFLVLAQNKKTSPEILSMIATRASYDYLARELIINENTPAEALLCLAQKRTLAPGLKPMIAQHKNATLEVIKALQLDTNAALAFALNANTAPEMLAHFARDPSLQGTAVIPALLRHVKLPVEVLWEVVNQRRIPMEERLAIAQNPNAPTEALDILAAELGPRLRALIAGHPNTSRETLQFLSQSKVTEIREAALRRLGPLP